MVDRLVVVVCVAGFASAATTSPVAADDAVPKPPPLDAPADCVAPTDGQGLPTARVRGPRQIGTVRLTHGKATVAHGFRLKVRTGFLPAGHGQPGGEELVGLTIEDLAAIKRDGVSYRNTVDQHGLDPVRIDRYRVTVRRLPAKVTRTPRAARFTAVIEDLSCLAQYTHPPLAKPGDAVTVWLSTEATDSYRLSTGEWFEPAPDFGAEVSAGIQSNAAVTRVKGQQVWIALNAHDNLSGRGESMRITNRDLIPGARLTTPAYTVEVKDVRLDPDTIRTDDVLINERGLPKVDVLVRIVSRATP